MVIKQFTHERIDLVANMAAGVWGKEQGAHSSEVARIFCQHLTRYSLYSVDLAFQAEDEDGAKLGKTLLLYQSEAWLWCTCAECIDRTAQRAWNRMAVPLD